MRAMQSFGAPRPTSNPYIHMLDTALSQTAGITHLRFNRRRALLGRYDILHFHWPETLFGGSTPSRKLLRNAFALALGIRLAVTKVAVVRTAHNIALPKDVTRWERRYLQWIERRTDHRIVLNERTAVPAGSTSTLIKHGHYLDWFSSVPSVAPTANTIAFVGLVRRYKGVEDLLAAFTSTSKDAPDLRLHVAGNPTGAVIEREVRELAALDSRVELDLRYLSETDFANAVMKSAGVVLPYRAMHNSGTVLAALSLGRPVLVPRNEVTMELANEVGPGWITCFDDTITGAALHDFARAAANPPETLPDLSSRDWHDAGIAHRNAFRKAIAHRNRVRH